MRMCVGCSQSWTQKSVAGNWEKGMLHRGFRCLFPREFWSFRKRSQSKNQVMSWQMGIVLKSPFWATPNWRNGGGRWAVKCVLGMKRWEEVIGRGVWGSQVVSTHLNSGSHGKLTQLSGQVWPPSLQRWGNKSTATPLRAHVRTRLWSSKESALHGTWASTRNLATG